MPGSGKYVYSQQLCKYKFTDRHPFDPLRLELTTDLLIKMGVLSSSDILSPSPASFEDLALVHDPPYIEMVKNACLEKSPTGRSLSCGLGTDDNPIFRNMHLAASLAVGATIKAAEVVLENQATHSINISGGLHHAQQNQASGFCIYNDIAVAIAWMRKKYQLKVMYIDTDAHHGDGVQWFFYSDPNVLTVSIHESGSYLFPGTGNIDELGVGLGKGNCINLPMEPYTNDSSYQECLENLLPEITKKFRPDIIISQNGCDIHHLDPLSHISVTNKTLSYIPKRVHQLAHEYAQGRWVAVGGGGYDIWNVVPRAWSFVWGEVSDRVLPNLLPDEWLKNWQKLSPVPLLETLNDQPCSYKAHSRINEIKEKNIITLTRLLQSQGGVIITAKNNSLEQLRLETPVGYIVIEGPVTPDYLKALDLEPCLKAFRSHEKQKSALIEISALPEGRVFIARHDNLVVGYVTFHRPDDYQRWSHPELSQMLELGGIEVSKYWRHYGLASKILEVAFSTNHFEDKVVISNEYYWHWDLEDTNLKMWEYRNLMEKLLTSVDFDTWVTDEPEIISHPANMFSVRVGKKVNEETIERFKKLCMLGI